MLLGPRRADGLHELVSLIESVSLADRLTIGAGDSEDQVICPGVPEPNLVSLALKGLRERGWQGPPLRVEIEKRVPVAGGMGGGSADAAALLRTAGSLAPLPERTIRELAAALGADVPSQLEPGLTRVSGAGEQVQRLSPLEPHALVILPQPYELSSAAVYAEADRLGLPRDHIGPSAREQLGVNDLQPAALSLRPELGQALASITSAGADHALVSGSGPTVFGIFWGAEVPELARRLPGAVVALPVGDDAGRPRRLG